MKNLKSRQFGIISFVIFSIFIVSTGMVFADQVVPGLPSDQGISVQTVRIVEGLVMEQSSLALQISNQSLPTNSSSSPMLNPGQIIYTTAYDQSITAQGGITTLVKDLTINTKNTVAGQSNVKADTSVTFIVYGRWWRPGRRREPAARRRRKSNQCVRQDALSVCSSRWRCNSRLL